MSKYFSLFVRIWKLFKPFHRVFYLQLTLVCVIGALDIYHSINLGNIVTSVATKDMSLITKSLIVYGLFSFTFWTFDFAYDYIQKMYFSRKSLHYLREISMREVLKLNISQFQENNSAIKYETVSVGEDRLSGTLENVILEIIPTIVVFIFTIITLFNYNHMLSLVVISGCVFIIFLEFRYLNRMRPLNREAREKHLLQYKISLEAFTHLSLIKSLSIENKFIKNFIKKREDTMNFNMQIDKKQELYQGKRNYIIATINIIAIFMATQLYIKGALLIGSIFVIFQITNKVLWKARDLQVYIARVVFQYVDIEKYLDLIDLQPEFNEHGKLKLPSKDKLKNAEDFNTEIVFKNLTFKYPKGDSNVLDDINLTIPHGKRTAFVGHSGSGKTTIVKLLMRAYDYAGVRVESNAPLGELSDRTEGVEFGPSVTIGGLELRDIDSHSLRSAIGYVEQHVDLFDTTVRDNILMSVDEDTLTKWEKLDKKSKKNELSYVNQKLEEVSKLARIDEFYHRLGEKKWDTEIGERGIKLSGGERQRVGIARAIIKDPSILILDEATSALDTINEKYIKEAIDNVSIGRTTIIIAHRLSTVEDADMIVVMDRGAVVATGTHDELLLSSAHYQELVAAQLK